MSNTENPEEPERAPIEKTSAQETPNNSAERQKRTPYHDAAFGVVSCLLHKYRQNNDIELLDEHRLSKEPLRIDIVVIKKNRDVELEPIWAKIFREHNLVEYKSPADKAPTLAVFDKLTGYARIYAAQENVKISDMTVTLICARTPQKLFKTLKKDFDYKILQKYDGIYYIMEKGVDAEKRLAIQVMVQESELLLQAMDKKPLDEATADKVAESLTAMDEDCLDNLGYWLKALSPENLKNIFERMGEDMTKREKIIMEFIESYGLSDRLQREGIQKGRQEGRLEGRLEGAQEVINLLEKGYSLAEAKKKLKLETAERAAN
jgi:type I site-specific restriction-modification system R (restriction) subunit